MSRFVIHMLVIFALVLLTAIAPSAGAQAAIHQPVRVNIPMQPLGEALKTLADQGDFQIVFTAEAVKDRVAPEVVGTMAPEQALATLLAGTSLEFVRIGNAYVVRPHLDDSVTQTGEGQGEGASRASVAAAQTPDAGTRIAQAEPAEGSPPSHPETEVQTVTVTGSRIGSTAAAEEGAAPVEVITVEEIRKTGAATVYEALASQPQFAGYADNDTRAGAQDTKEVNLRGLGAQYTLVLVDGRRIAQNNLNLIPFAAVERLEILKDGASAVYGSDALAGVVNVILRKDYDGFEADASYGNTTHYGDGGRTTGSFISGVNGERGSFLLSGEYEKYNPIVSLEHPMGRSDDQRPFGGQDLRSQRFNPGIVTFGDGTTAMLDSSFGVGETGTSRADYVPVYDVLLDKRRVNNLQNRKEVATIFARGSFNAVDEKVVLFADYLHKSGNLQYLDHRGTFLNYTVPAANYWNPFGEDVSVNYLLDYGTPGRLQERPLESMRSSVSTDMFTAGVRGTVGRVSYDLAYTNYETDDIQAHVGLSRARILEQLARTDEGALNLFGNDAVTADQLEPARAVFHREYQDYVRSMTAVVRFAPFQLPAGDLGTAVGAEKRKQGLAWILDEALNTFGDSASLTFLNDTSLAGDRDVDAYFAEVYVPIASPQHNFRGVRDLELSLAARTEKYSDFGDATVKRATLRWQPFESDALTFRASYGESFYAPDLYDLQPFGDTNVDPYEDPLILDVNGDPIRYEMVTTSGGNPDLQPTEGEYINFGVIVKPVWVPRLTITADLWKLDQTEAFVYPSVDSVIAGTAPGVVTRAPVALPGEPVGRILSVVNRAANAATRNVAGIDFNIAYVTEPGRFGRWSIASYNTYTSKFDYDQRDGLGEQSALGLVTDFDAVPRFRSNLVLGNEIGAWTFTLGTNYFGHVRNTFDDFARVESYLTSDLTILYDFDKRTGGSAGGVLSGTQVALNIDNVFDEKPPFYGDFDLRGIASNYSYVDYVGQFVTLNVRKKF